MVKLQAIGWAKLVGVASFGLIGSYIAFAMAVSGVVRTRNPDLALTLVPFESYALAASADRKLFENPSEPGAEVQLLARRSLRQQALNPRALRILGFYAETQGNLSEANRFIRQAEKLSRREIGAQLWLIEASARRNETATTLRHYDYALSTKTSAQAILFPRLLQAIEAKDVRIGMKPYMRAKRDWSRAFLAFAIAENRNLPQVVDLITESGQIDRDNYSLELSLLSKLVTEAQYTDARKLYLRLPGASAERLVSVGLEHQARAGNDGAIAWQVFDGADAGGGFSPIGKGRNLALFLSANPSTTHTIASKILYLNPGNYALTATLASLVHGDGGSLRWQLRCPTAQGQPIWWIDSVKLSLSTQFAVPRDCPVQFLDLVVSGGREQKGLEATVASVSVRPAS